MTTRYRLMTRGNRGGNFYCVDKTTGKRTSLKTTDRDQAQQIVEAKNQAERQAGAQHEHKVARMLGQRPTSTRITH